MAGGLPTPRPPAEIQGGKVGSAVLNRDADIKTNTGQDVTDEFILGAQKTLALAQKHHIPIAVLKAKSPSCHSKNQFRFIFKHISSPIYVALFIV